MRVLVFELTDLNREWAQPRRMSFITDWLSLTHTWLCRRRCCIIKQWVFQLCNICIPQVSLACKWLKSVCRGEIWKWMRWTMEVFVCACPASRLRHLNPVITCGITNWKTAGHYTLKNVEMKHFGKSSRWWVCTHLITAHFTIWMHRNYLLVFRFIATL